MLKLIEDIIYSLPLFEIRHSRYYKLVDLLHSLETIGSNAVEISSCSLTPYYIDINGTYEIYHQSLGLYLVNEPMFEKHICSLFDGKSSNDIDPYYLKLHATCFIESIFPSTDVDVSSIINWIRYVIEDNTKDRDFNKMINKYFNDDCLDINKLYFDLLIG